MIVQYANIIKKFCIIAAKEKWNGFYHDFNEVINAIETNKWYPNLGKNFNRKEGHYL